MRVLLVGAAAAAALLATPVAAQAWDRGDAYAEVQIYAFMSCKAGGPGPNCRLRNNPVQLSERYTFEEVDITRRGKVKMRRLPAYNARVSYRGFSIYERECPDGTVTRDTEEWRNHQNFIVTTEGVKNFSILLPGWTAGPVYSGQEGFAAMSALRPVKDPCANHQKKGKGAPRAKCRPRIVGQHVECGARLQQVCLTPIMFGRRTPRDWETWLPQPCGVEQIPVPGMRHRGWRRP